VPSKKKNLGMTLDLILQIKNFKKLIFTLKLGPIPLSGG